MSDHPSYPLSSRCLRIHAFLSYLSIYAHEFFQLQHAEKTRDALSRPLARSWNTPLARGAYWWRVRPWAKWLNCGSWRPAASGFDRAERPYKQAYEGASMSLRSSLYRSARLLGDVQAVASGNPKRITRRAKNKIVGRALGRSGFWRHLWR